MVVRNARNRTEGAWFMGGCQQPVYSNAMRGGLEIGEEPNREFMEQSLAGGILTQPAQGGIKHGVQAKVAVTSTNLRGNLYQTGTAR